MKKFRLLAALLAILMLPIGLLVACNDDTPDDPGTEDPGTDNPGTEDPGTDKPEVDNTVYDDDGTGDGYIMFYDFDAAARGDFRVDTKPYSSAFEITTEQEGILYIVDPNAGKTKGALLIQRENTSGAAELKVTASKIDGLTAQHVIEFDIKVGEGYITDTVTLTGVKGTEKHSFLQITPKGVADGDGNLLYTMKGDEGWLHIGLAIDDEARTYNIYVNGGKLTKDAAYKSDAYEKWSSMKTTTYDITTGATDSNLYCYIDNFGISTGYEPKVRDNTKDDVTYTDAIADSLMYYESTKEGYYKLLESAPLSGSSIKKDPYAAGFGLQESFGMNRYNETTGLFTPIVYDYGVELGLYGYGADFGGKAFKLDADNYVYFKPTHEYQFVAKIGGADVTGTYALSGTTSAPQVDLIWNDGILDKTLYGKLNLAENKIAFYTDDDYKEGEAIYALDAAATALPFAGKYYGFTGSNTRIYFIVYDYLGLADIVVEGATAAIGDDVAYTYADGVLKITAGETEYSFTYDAAADTFKYQETTFGIYDAWALMADEYLAAKFTNFASFMSTINPQNMEFAENWNTSLWSKVRFRYYIPEDGINYQSLIVVDTGNSAEGWSYWSAAIKQSKVGWYTYENLVTKMGASRSPDASRINGKWQFTTSGWSNGAPGGTKGTAVDGYSIYIRDFGFVADRSVIVEGPAIGKDTCTHEKDGATTFAPMADPIPGGCVTPGYYALKCSECGATKVDKTKPTSYASGHVVDETAEAIVALPTCETDGRTYKVCAVCGDEVTISVLPATGHDNGQKYDAVTKKMVITCKVCGDSNSFTFDSVLLTSAEKQEKLGLVDNTNIFYVAADKNIGAISSKGNMEFTMKNATVTGLEVNGVYAFEHKRTNVKHTNADSYFDINPMNTIKSGNPIVFEFSVMLGQKASDGRYLFQNINLKDRKVMQADVGSIGVIDVTGELLVQNNTAYSVMLSETEFTHFAFVCKPKTNSLDVYVNGYLRFENLKLSGNARIAELQVEDIRFTMNDKNWDNEVAGEASIYYNNVMFYSAEYPVNMLGVGEPSDSVAEYEGDIALEGVTDGKVTVGAADVALKMPQYTFTSQYVLDFTLTGALEDGALLTGVKNDAYRFEEKEALITVKGDYIYVLDTAICKKSEAADGVKITLELNDVDGNVTVYVDGNAVPGGFISYRDNYYGAAGGSIQGFIFNAAAGAYEVKDFAMYTGVMKTAE